MAMAWQQQQQSQFGGQFGQQSACGTCAFGTTNNSSRVPSALAAGAAAQQCAGVWTLPFGQGTRSARWNYAVPCWEIGRWMRSWFPPTLKAERMSPWRSAFGAAMVAEGTSTYATVKHTEVREIEF